MAVGIKIFFVLLLNLVASGHLQKQVTGAGGSALGSTQYNQPHNSHSHLIFNRSYSEDSWLRSLAWNLFGYATVIIPAYLAIRVVRNSDQFNERDGRGCLFKFIKICVYGSDADDVEVGNPSNTTDKTSRTVLKLMFCAVGLQGSYLTWGVLQERVMTQTYGEGKNTVTFKNSQFLVFMNRVFALLVAGVYISLKKQRHHTAPLYQYSYSSLSNILSSWCQYEALKFVSFPTQVLGKASKMIPVMIMGKFVSRKTYQYYEYIIAGLISVGVSLFLLAVATGKHNSAETTLSGLLLMLGYVGFDSFTSNWQSQLFTTHKMSSMQMMFGTNVFSSLFTAITLLQSGGMFSSIRFIMQYPTFGSHVVTLSLASAIGQLFIFYTISTFGPLVFTTIMVTRQMFSILLSCIIYQHSLAPQAILGMIIVFFALLLQSYARWRVKKLKQISSSGSNTA